MLEDDCLRKRFEEELDTNFSVIAPAGVGKTTAIVRRIIRMISADAYQGTTYCASLVVVTYTHKAASEMRERVQAALREKPAYQALFKAFTRIFFGTLHSFALELIKQFGPYIGISPTLQIVEDEGLWQLFLQETPNLYTFLDACKANSLRAYIPLQTVLDLVPQLSPELECAELQAPPLLDLQPLLGFTADKRNAQGVQKQKDVLEKWIRSFEIGRVGIGIPACNYGGKAFQRMWQDAFQPLKDWMVKASLHFAAKLLQAYSNYKYKKGMVNYDDIIFLANQLLLSPTTASKLEANHYRILLDEAQDTDSHQFQLLLGLSGGRGLSGSKICSSAGGYYCMVGDPQQSIYSSRTGVATYLSLHQRLVAEHRVAPLCLQVTLRCDQSIVNWVNASLPAIFKAHFEPDLHFPFIPLTPRPNAAVGSVVNFQLQETFSLQSTSEAYEAHCIASFIKSQGYEGLGIKQWSELAILCPRRKWLAAIAAELQAVGLQPQMHSSELLNADNPIYAWFTAVLYTVAHPCDGLEVVGVLREVLGFSDAAIAQYVLKYSLQATAFKNARVGLHPLNILLPNADYSPVGRALQDLQAIRNQALNKPLRAAVGFIIEALGFKKRIQFLETNVPDSGAYNTLNTLLVKASKAEWMGMTLTDFAEELIRDLDACQEESNPKPHCIQLYTCHKAKGLEWSVVMLPFLFRPIRFPTSPYPRLVKDFESNQPHLIWDKDHETNAPRPTIRKELSQLLYVALTRAKNKLILVDDHCLYQKDNYNSLADIMRIETENADAWKALQKWYS